MEPGNTSLNKANKKRKPGRNYGQGQENNKDSFISCSLSLIHHMLNMTIHTLIRGDDKLSCYMDEMLHSIFFLGYIYDSSKMDPKKFFKTDKIYDLVKKLFCEAFQSYTTHLPTRTPFSILLNMMEILHSTENKIKEELLKLLKELRFPNPLHKPGSKYEEYYTLESTVICVCYSDSDPQRYYGASLSCRKQNAKRILIDLSCLQTWHEYVSHAVMSFYPEGPGDGITFPESVKCQAYFRDRKENVYEEKRPCLNCKQLFNLKDADPDKVFHPYGNCAETECLSNLLKSNTCIAKKTQLNNYTAENLKKLRGETKDRLIKELKMLGIEIVDQNILFYSPVQRKGDEFKNKLLHLLS
ncbi:uncharacterized protein LOC132870451 [Neoarius graeffei]|uniref:uncharacterized protein LOC132870451 n=1 Tax=Neoarius graeffei TaxID=443677 RepID=UPI00298BE8BF|nr:uncharacterized protein LOC132870451 [Neoarius graeffei]